MFFNSSVQVACLSKRHSCLIRGLFNFLVWGCASASLINFQEMDCDIASYHVESFNYLADEGANLAALDVPPEKFRLPNGEAVELRYTYAQLGYPTLNIQGVSRLAVKLCY